MLKAILLDLDGTLIDSNDAHAAAWVEALREFGIAVAFQQARELIGMGSDHLLPELTGLSADSPRGKNIADRRGEIFRNKFLKNLKPFPKAKEFVQKLLEAEYKVVVATSASEKDLRGLLKQIGIEKLIDYKTTSDDAENSKPSPDIILEALKKAKAKPEEAIMIGDTPYDIKAASKAGVRTIAFTSGGWSTDKLRDAAEIYNDPQDLLNNFDNSILRPQLQKKRWGLFNVEG